MTRFTKTLRHRCGRVFSFTIMALFAAGSVAWGQPQWRDIGPFPGEEVAVIPKIISDEEGLWATACDIPNGACYFYSYGLRPYYSSDGGDTWELRDNGIPEQVSVSSVAINPDNPDILLAFAMNPPFGPPYRSTDRGMTWRETSDGIRDDDFSWSSKVGWFPDGIHAYCFIGVGDITGGDAYYISADIGQTWQYIRRQNPARSVYTTPLSPGLILVSDFTVGILRSSNFGYTWEDLYSHDYIAEEIFASTGEDLDTIYATGAVWRGSSVPMIRYYIFTADTGRSFQMLNPADTLRWTTYGDGWGLKDPLRRGHLFHLRRDTLFETRDNGQTWEALWGGPDYDHNFGRMGYNPFSDRIYVIERDDPIRMDSSGLWRLDRYSSAEPRLPASRTPPSVLLFPNPVTSGGTLTLELPGQPLRSVVLYNLLGQEVYRLAFAHHHNPGGNPVHVTLPSAMPSGIYFINVTTNRQSVLHKVVVQH